MTFDPKQPIRNAIAPILDYLRSLPGKDARQARDAVKIIEEYLGDTNLSRTELLESIDFAMGGQGLLNRPWSDRTTLENLLTDHWWSKRFWMDPDRSN